MQNRREFLFGTGALLALGGCKLSGVASSGAFDDNLTVFVSDVHIHPGSYQSVKFETVVERILAMRPLPRQVVVFGDIAYLYGHREDYEASRPLFDRLTATGIKLTLGLGNHDRRGHFHEVWADYSSRELVPGRVVSETSLGDCDLIMLDTLCQDKEGETVRCEGDGELGGGQFEWLKAEMPKRQRPFFLGAHHPINEIRFGHTGKELGDLIMATPNCLGWIHGHDHVWRPGLVAPSDRKWGDNNFKRTLCLPSSGHWGDIGYVTLRTSPGCARAELTMLDHFFPRDHSPRTWIDRALVEEKQNQSFTVRWMV